MDNNHYKLTVRCICSISIIVIIVLQCLKPRVSSIYFFFSFFFLGGGGGGGGVGRSFIIVKYIPKTSGHPKL